MEYGRKRTKRLLHSYGAIECLERLLGMLAPGGFILVNDYGQTQITRDDEFEHQRFSLATFVGVNFSLLRAYFGEGKRCQYLEPGDEEGRGIHARLLAPTVAEDVFVRFHERFGAAAHQRLQEPIQKARACTKDALYEWGRTGKARSAYEKALAVNAADVRARYNLAWVHAREREYPQALVRIAEALALDKTGEFRDQLLQKQKEVEALQARRHQQEYLLLINLVSKYAKPEREREENPENPPVPVGTAESSPGRESWVRRRDEG